AFAAALPVLASAYKLRVLDAAVLLLSGALAVYNVNCLTAGSCNTWATVVSVSFFIMTILQIMTPREGLEGEEEAKKEAVDAVVAEVTEVPAKAEEKPAEPAPTEAKMPAEAKPEKAMAKTAPIITTDEEFELLKAQLMQ
ncbi:MAG: hypothetical protein ACO3LT_10665, partial [Ilumatobacteraceae bacterium]